jgi:hypothetical protein
VNCPPPPGPGPEGKSTVVWKAVAAGGLVIAAGGGYWWYHNSTIIDDVRKEQCDNGWQNHCTPSVPKNPAFDIKASDSRGDKASTNTWVGGITMGVGLGVAAFGIVKIVTSSSKSTEHQAARGHRVRKERTFVVTPVVSPQGGGATLRLDW